MQVLVAELMTDSDLRADGLVSQALQSCLLMLSASETEGLIAAADLLQHLMPSQKHLVMLQRHVQVLQSVHRDGADDQLARDYTERHQTSLKQCIVDTVLPSFYRQPFGILLTGHQVTITCVIAVVDIALMILQIFCCDHRTNQTVFSSAVSKLWPSLSTLLATLEVSSFVIQSKLIMWS